MTQFPNKKALFSAKKLEYKSQRTFNLILLIIFDFAYYILFSITYDDPHTPFFFFCFLGVFGIGLLFGNYILIRDSRKGIIIKVYEDYILIKKSYKKTATTFHKKNIKQINTVKHENKYTDSDGKQQILFQHQTTIKLKGGKEYKIEIHNYSLNEINKLTLNLNKHLDLKKAAHLNDSNNTMTTCITPIYLDSLIHRFHESKNIQILIDKTHKQLFDIEKLTFNKLSKTYFDLVFKSSIKNFRSYRIVSQNDQLSVFELENIDLNSLNINDNNKLSISDLPDVIKIGKQKFEILKTYNQTCLIRPYQKEQADIKIQKYNSKNSDTFLNFYCLNQGKNYVIKCYLIKRLPLEKFEILTKDALQPYKSRKKSTYKFLNDLDKYKTKSFENLVVHKSYYEYIDKIIRPNYKKYVINEKVLELLDQPLRTIISLNKNDYFLVTKLIYITYNLSFQVIFRLENEKEIKLLCINNSGDLFELDKINIHELLDKNILKEKSYNKFPNILRVDSIKYKKRQFNIGEQFNHNDEQNKTTFFKFEYSDTDKENILLLSKISGDNYVDGFVGKKIENTLELN
ncbi:hypothetical protein MY04_5016 [Flammeovirga sp. MY04]|uniref:hypothetical protein n=1 Tax=Flammeovirga sp. MY04 TaxID=1191459 RepID=UPI000806284A|nr:hypothetical protein [Flammeovirga sp. MY04]ANQ52351.1 hypothetical protein MY04_5016 [Flammeovirga sp. MY04]